MIDVFCLSKKRLDELHEKYGLSKTREAEEMCNYSQYLEEKGVVKGLKQGKEEGREEEKLSFLKNLVALQSGDLKP